MSKFKVGDKVKIVRKHCTFNQEGLMDKWIGKVMTIRRVNDIGYKMEEDIEEGPNGGWLWSDNCMELAKPECIVIYRKGNETIALDKVAGKKAIAKCSPDDTFDFEIGAKLAFERLMTDKVKEVNEPEPQKYYNGKVVCVKSRNDFLTTGKIYEFRNGRSVSDDGGALPFSGKTKSLRELNNRMDSDFIEIVEDK